MYSGRLGKTKQMVANYIFNYNRKRHTHTHICPNTHTHTDYLKTDDGWKEHLHSTVNTQLCSLCFSKCMIPAVKYSKINFILWYTC